MSGLPRSATLSPSGSPPRMTAVLASAGTGSRAPEEDPVVARVAQVAGVVVDRLVLVKVGVGRAGRRPIAEQRAASLEVGWPG